MEPILVATGARPFSRLILTRGDEDVNFDHVERQLGFRFFRRLSIRVKTNFLRNQKRQISVRCRNPDKSQVFAAAEVVTGSLGNQGTSDFSLSCTGKRTAMALAHIVL
jgi:hypothetical protein